MFIEKEDIEIFQHNLPAIRHLLGWSRNDLANSLGITRQQIYNFEIGKTKIKKFQYMAFRFLLDQGCEMGYISDEAMDYIETVLLKKCVKITVTIEAE